MAFPSVFSPPPFLSRNSFSRLRRMRSARHQSRSCCDGKGGESGREIFSRSMHFSIVLPGSRPRNIKLGSSFVMIEEARTFNATCGSSPGASSSGDQNGNRERIKSIKYAKLHSIFQKKKISRRSSFPTIQNTSGCRGNAA